MTASGPGTALDGGLERDLAAFAALAPRTPDGGAPAGGPLLVASDFDGVLAPLGDDPLASRPTPASAAALARLATLGPDRVRVALVSGRRIEDLARLASPPLGALLVGSHGAETGEVLAPAPEGGPADGPGVAGGADGADGAGAGDAPGAQSQVRADGTTARVRLVPVALDDSQTTLLDRVTQGLEEIAAPVEGAWVEYKPSAAVLHTRLSSQLAADEASAAAALLGDELGAHAMTGKNVVEIAVTSTSKGIALDALRTSLGSPAVLYLGDDVTDERAFAVLGASDLGIKVGPGETLARRRVADPAEAARALTALADLLGA
ncbi:trehalose-phosphatase [Oerskovia enterophila]|uniref:Trehalose-phosphate phosphatase n=1 Tax=Oerskovia enterophila TaxID=43678 RepID=A0ABX2Y0Y5_9CELL|nr:trehalose-phosphatase [Oerskovia enterophila]OCI30121.1 trehalose-phosphate phosphatase [Oerskovia enterophila]